MTWTPERTALLLDMRARGLAISAMAKRLGPEVTRSAVSGKLSRLEGRAKRYESQTRYKPKPRKYTAHITGDWDQQTFEPYAVRKERLAVERANALR